MDGLLHIEAVETLTGLEGAWIRVKDHGWTLATLAYMDANMQYNAERCVEWVHRWVVECNLPALPADGTPPDRERLVLEPITDPKALTVDILENEVDSKLLGFLMTAIQQGARTALTLSPFAFRISSNGTEPQPAAPSARSSAPAKPPSRRRKK